LNFDILTHPWQPASSAPADVCAMAETNRVAALQFMREQPSETLWLTARKLALFYAWSYYPRYRPGADNQTEEVPQYRLRAWLYAASVRPLFLLAGIGLVWGWRRHAGVRALGVFLILLGLGHALLHAMPRFRIPFEPLLAVLAGGGAIAASTLFRRWKLPRSSRSDTP
jgi:hypothetical protein